MISIVQDIVDYMEANLESPLTPAIIAGRFYVSVSSVNVLFKAICGIPLMEYLRNRRLTLAGRELLTSDIRVIDLAYKYTYETPESFTKAFTRFHGVPPSFVRRVYPQVNAFEPLRINLKVEGGWTKTTPVRQDLHAATGYIECITSEGGRRMQSISTKDMKRKKDWAILCAIAKELDGKGIAFKVDGKTMVFAHGLEFPLEKICLTFRWDNEQRVLDFFNYEGKAKSTHPDFKYFDSTFEGMTIRCMFYDCPEDGFHADTDIVYVDGQAMRVQSLEFFLKNAMPDEVVYPMVERWMNGKSGDA